MAMMQGTPEAPGAMGGMQESGMMEQGAKGGMKTFYIPGYEGVAVGDTVNLKVVALDEDTGDLEVEWAGKAGGESESENYTPEEVPEEAFT
jgi:hypothetical protein